MFELDPPIKICSLSETKPGELIVYDPDCIAVVLPSRKTVFSITELRPIFSVDEAGNPIERFNCLGNYGCSYFFRGESSCIVASSAAQVPEGSLVVAKDRMYIAYSENNGRIRLACLNDGVAKDPANVFEIAYFERWSIVVPPKHGVAGEKIIRVQRATPIVAPVMP